MKRFILIAVFLAILILVISQLSLAQEAAEEETEKKALKLEEVRVTAPRQEEDIVVAPSMTTINIEEYKITGTPQNIVDILKDRAIIDFRGQSDLVPGKDDIYMRGFDAHRFTTSMDGMTIDYGRSAASGTRAMVVDFATLPLNQIESIEIMPGPHSALYGGKSMGGVINLKTKTPERYTSLKPDFRASTSYRSYNTQNHSINADGGAGPFVYGLSYQYYHTNGYLRNNRAENQNYFAKFGYILPSDGYISLDLTYNDQNKGYTVKNAPGNVDYNNNYPVTTTTSAWPWQERETHTEEYTYRLNYKQPTQTGLWTLGAYYGNQDWKRSYFREKDTGKSPEVKPDEIERYSSTTTNRQAGGRIQDEIELFENHTLTMGFDMIQMWEPSRLYYNFRYSQHKTADIKGWYLQDRYTIIPRLTLTAGLRYEDVSYWRSNRVYNDATKFRITGYGPWIRRNSNQWIPKSFLTYELDDLSDMLRDTSVSLGISKIWNPLPFCYG